MLRIINKIEEVKVYPSTTAEHVKCLVCDEQDHDKTWEATYHKTEVELIELINHLQKSLKLYPTTVDQLWEKIENFGQRKFEEGSNSEAESNAGADL